MPLHGDSALHVQIVSPEDNPSSVTSGTSGSSAGPPFGSIAEPPTRSTDQADTSAVKPEASRPKATWSTQLLLSVLRHRWFSWIPKKLTWAAMKPVIRCATAVSLEIVGRSLFQAWIGLLVQLILPSERALGYAACEICPWMR